MPPGGPQRGRFGTDYLPQARVHHKAYVDTRWQNSVLENPNAGALFKLPQGQEDLNVASTEIAFTPDDTVTLRGKHNDGPYIRTSLNGAMGEYRDIVGNDSDKIAKIFRRTHRVLGWAYHDTGGEGKSMLTTITLQSGGSNAHVAHETLYVGDIVAARPPDPNTWGNWNRDINSVGSGSKATLQLRRVAKNKSYFDEYEDISDYLKKVRWTELDQADVPGLDAGLAKKLAQGDIAKGLKLLDVLLQEGIVQYGNNAVYDTRSNVRRGHANNDEFMLGLMRGFGFRVGTLNFTKATPSLMELMNREDDGILAKLYSTAPRANTELGRRVAHVYNKHAEEGIAAHSELFGRSREEIFGTVLIPAIKEQSAHIIRQI